ncbi:hypothetical protein KC959_00995 [Candidatus Saccharibacteria bacterium]|nr:hypothetical protein [Candidatus Saccharibacteria bacterium]
MHIGKDIELNHAAFEATTDELVTAARTHEKEKPPKKPRADHRSGRQLLSTESVPTYLDLY